MHFRRVLVPLDGSELAERAIAPALRIVKATAERDAGDGSSRARLVLLRAVSPISLVAADPMLYDEMARMSLDEAQTYLNIVASNLADAGHLLETKAISGPSADAIVHYAEETGVDLIVMSSHGRTGSKRWVYGSVAEKVMHHAPCATAIIRAHVSVNMFENRKMVVPLDGSELAERALAPALSLAEKVESDVFLLRVYSTVAPDPESLSPSGESLGASIRSASEAERAEAEAYLQRIYSSIPNHHVFFDVRPTTTDAADAIVSYAEENHADLIVMSSHGRTGIGRWLHGSVAEKVLRGADCATLIVRRTQD